MCFPVFVRPTDLKEASSRDHLYAPLAFFTQGRKVSYPSVFVGLTSLSEQRSKYFWIYDSLLRSKTPSGF